VKIASGKTFSAPPHILQRLANATRGEEAQRCRQADKYAAAKDNGLHTEVGLRSQSYHWLREKTLAEDPHSVAADYDHEQSQDNDEQVAQV
jgi:hypothetical protein